MIDGGIMSADLLFRAVVYGAELLIHVLLEVTNSRLARQLSDIIDDLKLIKDELGYIERFFEHTPSIMNISPHEKLLFKGCYDGAYAYVAKFKKLGKQINHTIWGILGDVDSNLPRRVQLGIVLTRVRIKMSTIAALNEQLMGKRTGLQIILQTLQRFHDQHTQNNFFERLIGVTQRPTSDTTIAYENRVDIDIIKNEIFSVPQPLYRYFTGIEDVLQEIHDSLQSCSADGRPQQRKVTSITGDHGSGKTQLCCQFAERNRNSYGAVFWIDATSLTERAQQPQRSTEQGNTETSTTLKQISTYKKPWLLIIDNIDNIEKLSKICPDGDIGHILVTTKREPSNEMGHVIRLEGMDTEDAQGLLLMEAQRMKPWNRMELESANAIVKTLGEALPLALIRIARAVRNDLCSMEEYRQLLFERPVEEVRKGLPRNESSSTSSGCLANIATMDIALYLMKKQKLISSQDAIKLLHVFPTFNSPRVQFETVQKAVLDSRSVKVKKNWWPRKASKKPGDECIWVQRRRWTIRMRKEGSHRGPILSRLEHLAVCRTEWALMELIEMAFLSHDELNCTYSIDATAQERISEIGQKNPSQQAIWQRIADNAIPSSTNRSSTSGTILEPESQDEPGLLVSTTNE